MNRKPLVGLKWVKPYRKQTSGIEDSEEQPTAELLEILEIHTDGDGYRSGDVEPLHIEQKE